ncbi:hypothetical protein ORJ04_00385 [Rheinheimera baltica]|uniref:Mobile element protein n=1 Tax=Rheinheimera baltica TaxID=67576 RepID=A0ABT9HTF4_9GAMM|nr:hypothetical protein [Rheinheimera baltica]MDP5134404.1 hypothetical protein [Rheinheimera baltica]
MKLLQSQPAATTLIESALQRIKTLTAFLCCSALPEMAVSLAEWMYYGHHQSSGI